MPQKFGYIIDLADYKFDESTNDPTWIHAMPVGTYSHPVYGKIPIDKPRTQRFADSVTNRVRGQDLDIDYDHKQREDVAAGWVKAAETRNDGLYLLVDWTPRARKHLNEKEYRYFSPEYQDEWTHPGTGQKYTDVLFGGGLTNRPYLKGIEPITYLSETITEPERSKSMTDEQKKALIAKYKLSDDATDDQVLEAAAKADLKEPEAEPDKTQLSELQTQINELKKLSDTNPAMPAVIKLMEAQAEQMKSMSDQLAKNEAALVLSEMGAVVKRLDEKVHGKGYGLPKPVVTAATTFLSEYSKSKKFTDDFEALATSIIEAKLVQLGELRPGNGNVGNPDAIKIFNDKVNELTKDGKMSYRDAVEKVERDEPQVFSEYRTAQQEAGAA